MKTIQILGSGCAKCSRLQDAAIEAADELEIDYELEKVSDVARYAEFGVMVTPAMVVDGEVKVCGRVPSLDELKGMLS